MKAARTYVSLTGRSLTGNTLTWMQELVQEFGDDEVSESLEEHSLDVPADKLIGKVRDSLARQRLVEKRRTPRELDRDEFMGWVRGTWQPGEFPVIYDAISFHLTDAEYGEVVEWVRRMKRPRGSAPVPDAVVLPDKQRVGEIMGDIKAAMR
jgi:hypothetical protein